MDGYIPKQIQKGAAASASAAEEDLTQNINKPLNLRYINLAGCEKFPHGELLIFGKRCPDLQVIDLRGWNFSETLLKEFIQIRRNHPNIKVIFDLGFYDERIDFKELQNYTQKSD